MNSINNTYEHDTNLCKKYGKSTISQKGKWLIQLYTLEEFERTQSTDSDQMLKELEESIENAENPEPP
jgi:hypothetical protein